MGASLELKEPALGYDSEGDSRAESRLSKPCSAQEETIPIEEYYASLK
jgi:hypothetical protein